MLMTIPQVCDYTACKRTTVYKLAAEGALEAVKIGSKTLITKRSVDALIERGIEAGQALVKR